MKDNFDIKDLWAKQTISPQMTAEMLSSFKTLQQKHWRRLILTNVLLIGTVLFIAFIWYYYQPQFLTTKIGIILAILAMVVYLSLYNQLIPSLKQMNFTQTNSAYLQQLKAFKAQQYFLQSKVMAAYFLLLGSGLCLYMYEYTSRMTLFSGILAYTLTLGWIGFNWFYLLPKAAKKQQAELDTLIQNLENISQQLTED
jgi:hypothetical protein